MLADRMARSLMVGVGVRQGVQRDRSAPQPAQDPPGGESRGRVDQHRPQQVDVDRVRWKAFEDEQVVSQLFHRILAAAISRLRFSNVIGRY